MLSLSIKLSSILQIKFTVILLHEGKVCQTVWLSYKMLPKPDLTKNNEINKNPTNEF